MKTMTIRWRWALPLLAVLALAGCNSNKDQSPESATTAAASEQNLTPQYGGNLVLASPGEPVTFNEHYYQDSASSDIITLIHAGLIEIDENFDVQPHVAKALPTVSEDGTEWVYHLREDVRFHDGEPLTAHDVVFSYSIFNHPDYTGPRSSDFELLERVEALDDYSVKFTLSEPSAKFATQVGYAILPKHLLADVPVAELGDYRAYNLENPIGAGPFVFDHYTRGQQLVLKANPDFFKGRPYLDQMTFRYVGDMNAAVLLLQTGDADHITVPVTEVETVRAMPHARLQSTLQLRYDYIAWNQRNPLFQDRRVRQALTMAIDRQEIVDTVMDGHATVAHAPVSPLSWSYSDQVPRFDYNLEAAKALMAEAGWQPGSDGILVKDGKRFSFEMLSNDGNVIRRDLAVIAQQYLRQLGVEVKPAQMEWGAFLEKINAPNYNFDAVVLAWGLAIDPDPKAIWHSSEIAQGLNNISYSNPELDVLLDENVRIIDQDERAKVLATIWQALAEDQPYTFMYYPQLFIGLNERVQGFTHHARVDMYKAYEWWLAQ